MSALVRGEDESPLEGLPDLNGSRLDRIEDLIPLSVVLDRPIVADSSLCSNTENRLQIQPPRDRPVQIGRF